MENRIKIGTKITNANGNEYIILDKLNNAYFIVFYGDMAHYNGKVQYILATNVSIKNGELVWERARYFQGKDLKSACCFFYALN